MPRWLEDLRLGRRRWLFVLGVVLLMLAYIAIVVIGGRIPSNLLLLPFIPTGLWGIPGLIWQLRQSAFDRRHQPSWLWIGTVLNSLVDLAIGAGVVVRYYLI